MKLLIAYAIFATSFASQVFANQTVELQMFDQDYGPYGRIDIREEIRRQVPNLYWQLDNVSVRRIVVRAKSYDGNGYVQLQLGNFDGDEHFVDGNPSDYYSNYPQTYSRVDFFIPNSSPTWGPWTLNINGRIRIQSILMIYDFGGNNNWPPNPHNTFQLTCNSWNAGYNRCVIPGSNAIDVSLVQQTSSAAYRCRYNVTWGWNNREIWVSQGCSGIFAVTVN